MSASGWLRAAVALGLGSAGVLAGAALAPLLIRPATANNAPLPAELDLVCLFVPTPADWPAHLIGYAILGLLLACLGRGLHSALGQTWRTQRTLRQLLQFARPVDPALQALLAPLHLAGRVDVVLTATPLAFCYGFIRPRVCLSTGLMAALTDTELTALLWHERYHLVRRDPARVALGRAWASAFFYVPLVRALYQHYLVAKELEADSYACGQQGSADALADALLVLLDLQGTRGADPALAVAAGATEGLELRVARLLGQPTRTPVPLWPAVVSAGLLLTLVGSELALAWTSLANTLWPLQHLALGGC